MIEEYKGQLPDNMLEDCAKKFEELKLTKKQQEDVLNKLKHDFNAAKINPGEAIGIITAESFGEPGTQMSTDFNEKIILKINDKIRIIKIGNFIDNLMELRGSLKLNEHSEILPLDDLEVYVPSLNQEEKIEWKRAIECSRHKHKNNLINIKTASGREITCTNNHSFVTRKDNSIIPIKGSDLKIGDRIPTINKFALEIYNKSVDLKEFFEEDYIFENENGLLGTRYHAKPIPRFLNLDAQTGWFIGAYLAEGSSSGNSIGISNLNDSYMNNAKMFIENINLDFTEDYHHRGFANGRDLRVNSTLLSKFIVNSCSKGADFKKVPQFAYSASDEFVSALLRGYFDGDGNFHVERDLIRASSNSKELVDGIALLLSRFKIFSYKVKDKKDQYWLLIPYKYAPQFLQFIGSDIDYKLEALEKMAVKARNFWNEKSQDYTDMISGFGNLFYNIAKKLGIMTRYVNSCTKRQKIGRTALYRWIKKFEQISKEKNVDISKELEIMNKMFNSDVVWDEIVEISKVNYNHKYVYDLSVPGLETFTTFNGIVTHNTLSVFHFAGVAEFAVTLGLPRLIEILDARKEMATPLIEVYVEKPDNKEPDKVKKIAASIKETKLSEITSEFAINLAKLQIEVAPNKQAMKDFGISDQYMIDSLQKEIKTASIKEADGKLIIKTKAKENELLETYKLKEKLKDVYIKGVRGITSVLPVKKENEFVIIATGTNLKDALQVKGVDATRTRANNPFEAVKILGIEAARQVIIDEIVKAFEDQGLDIDIRHAMFVADLMTATGEIKGITRSGITGEKESVLARASFETPIKHIVNASLIGEKDELNSVIENVILNQEIPLGTGLPDLVARMKTEEEKK